MSKQHIYTVSQIAAIVGRTPIRIRQICAEMDLGVKANSRCRVLTETDLRLVRRRLALAEKYRSRKKMATK